ncbi:hypothetical protein BJX76DRAFT_354711 [Aspergillus varians]
MSAITGHHSLSNLPTELLLQIAEYLSGKSLKRFAETSKHIFEVARPYRDGGEKNIFSSHIPAWSSYSARSPVRTLMLRFTGDGVTVTSMNAYKRLVSACEAGNIQEIKDLLSVQVPLPNIPNDKSGIPQASLYFYTVLQAAAHRNHTEAVHVLLEAGAKVNLSDYANVVFLFGKGYLDNETLDLLLTHGLIDSTLYKPLDYILDCLCSVGAPLTTIARVVHWGANITKPGRVKPTSIALAIRKPGD